MIGFSHLLSIILFIALIISDYPSSLAFRRDYTFQLPEQYHKSYEGSKFLCQVVCYIITKNFARVIDESLTGCPHIVEFNQENNYQHPFTLEKKGPTCSVYQGLQFVIKCSNIEKENHLRCSCLYDSNENKVPCENLPTKITMANKSVTEPVVDCHPSIRLVGTEQKFNPILCKSPVCSETNKRTHYHCPFCFKNDVYTDSALLKAHYRVKHVDKGMLFAGLWIIRCCDSCNIIGSIKGSKEFKGAHWHCYGCRNGFNRRDEALKHFRTHFKNPRTTFQIQLVQDVNQKILDMNKQDDAEGQRLSDEPQLIISIAPEASREVLVDNTEVIAEGDKLEIVEHTNFKDQHVPFIEYQKIEEENRRLHNRIIDFEKKEIKYLERIKILEEELGELKEPIKKRKNVENSS
ncbi:DgyrCDS9336 [Dimorphilus gyrociliatus]|uniref:DgyrCDS9336 n=1 Tax=Dimorphilus gyrociliatus TaxID=2664684 RepID=A0A7I8VY55_9ANNE|nr:DgyrCDS9336 [Dimorphilus gyrociliatus]